MTRVVVIMIVIISAGLVGYFVFLNEASPDVELTQTKAEEVLKLTTCRTEGIPEEYKSCTMDIQKNGNQWLVTVTYDGFYDDSVKAGRSEAVLEYKDDQWIVIDIVDKHQCWPGRGHQDFSKEFCI